MKLIMENWRAFLKEDDDDAYVDTKTKGLGSSQQRYQAGAEKASKQIPEKLKKEQQIISTLTEQYHAALKVATFSVTFGGITKEETHDVSSFTFPKFAFRYDRYGIPNVAALTRAINNLSLGKDKERDDNDWVNKKWFPKYSSGFLKLAKTILKKTKVLIEKIKSERGKISKREDFLPFLIGAWIETYVKYKKYSPAQISQKSSDSSETSDLAALYKGDNAYFEVLSNLIDVRDSTTAKEFDQEEMHKTLIAADRRDVAMQLAKMIDRIGNWVRSGKKRQTALINKGKKVKVTWSHDVDNRLDINKGGISQQSRQVQRGPRVT